MIASDSTYCGITHDDSRGIIDDCNIYIIQMSAGCQASIDEFSKLMYLSINLCGFNCVLIAF